MSTSGHLNPPFSPPRPLSRPSSRGSIRSIGRAASPVVTLADETASLGDWTPRVGNMASIASTAMCSFWVEAKQSNLQ
ncbi:hypothetical protein A0H81_06270 [Grifola frondosa]|uniref:Uncharacterized protein n=1 Tax=Grifola frondosa TaxID=5627 RepID=A0A1C7M9Q4_GRIFR|nr:hypothetical protein A0H81_06270 [Grifola frondosa]